MFVKPPEGRQTETAVRGQEEAEREAKLPSSAREMRYQAE